MGEMFPVVIGPSVSQELTYVHVEKRVQAPSVIVGESMQQDVAAFLAEAYPQQMDFLFGGQGVPASEEEEEDSENS